MRRFVFDLEPIRVLREQVEQRAEQALGLALAEQAARSEDVRLAEAAVTAARAATATAGAEPIGGVELVARQRYAERLEQELQVALTMLARQEQTVADRRAALAGARVEREALERLKERRAAQHAQAALRAEDEQLADVAISNYRLRKAAA